MSLQSLEELYTEISCRIAQVDFEKLWHGFRPLKFALYDDENCFFNGEYIEKTEEFVANTAIEFRGEFIAIWNVTGQMNPDVFASKIIHEMFHAFQRQNAWCSFASEMEALCRYQYNEENLSVKRKENSLLLELAGIFQQEKYMELLELRKYRQHKFPYEFHYEACVEDIEGSANYVEWSVLSQLNKEQAVLALKDMKNRLSNAECYFPIRICGYYTGALMHIVAKMAGENIYPAEIRPLAESLIVGVMYKDIRCETDTQMKEALRKYIDTTNEIIDAAIRNSEIVLEERLQMLSVNVYDARCLRGFITTRFFLMYLRDEKEETIQGNFVVKMLDANTIERVYRWV